MITDQPHPQPRRLIGIITPQSRQAPILEYSLKDQRWHVWTSYNDNLTAGTYMDLYGYNPLDMRFLGAIDRVTLQPDGSVEILTLLQHL